MGYSGGEDDDDEDGGPENKFPFGVPGEEASVGVSYATAEGEMSHDTGEERRKSMIFADREGNPMTTLQIKKGKGNKGKAKEPLVVRSILKSSPPFSAPAKCRPRSTSLL